MKRWILAASLSGGMGCINSTSCVARGSRISTPRGLRNIETLQVGDEVWCADTLTHEICIGRISAIRSARRECLSLGLGENQLVVTSDHPIYSPQSGDWAPAGDWALGKKTEILQLVGSRLMTCSVQQVSQFVGVYEVFDLTVDNPLHNFIAEGVVVHNKSPLLYCTQDDGGQQAAYGRCSCSDGGTGYIECESPYERAYCECGESVGDGSDGGSSDGGSDAGGDGG